MEQGKKLRVLLAVSCVLLALALAAAVFSGIRAFKSHEPYSELKVSDVDTIALLSDKGSDTYNLSDKEIEKAVKMLNSVTLGGKISEKESDAHMLEGGVSLYRIRITKNDKTLSVAGFWNPDAAVYFSLNGETYKFKDEKLCKEAFDFFSVIAKRELPNGFGC